MAWNLSEENLLHCFWGQVSTTYTCSNATEVAQWTIPSCCRPHPATNNGVRDDKSNRLAVNPTFVGSTP